VFTFVVMLQIHAVYFDMLRKEDGA